MPRGPRRAPKRKPDPLDAYSTWDIRIARAFFLATAITTLLLIIGIWVSVIIEAANLELFKDLPPSAIVALITGAILGHLVLLIILYIIFRGGKQRLLRVLFKDRRIAKKYEDFQTLRILIAITILTVYVLIVSLLIWILPLAFFQIIGQAWITWVSGFNVGEWIIYIAVIMYIIISILFIMFILWNHGVYWVLTRIKQIEEEEEVKEIIKKETLKKADEKTLREEYKKETGKNPLYRGKETGGYIEWKEKRLK
ncbi:MAG: hypothetical protein ACTSQJ_09235 [Promethearchaeota archaeon]